MTQKRLLAIERRCFLCDATKSYAYNKKRPGWERWYTKEDKYLCVLCYKKQYYLKNRPRILSIRRKRRDKTRKVPFKQRAPWGSVTRNERRKRKRSI